MGNAVGGGRPIAHYPGTGDFIAAPLIFRADSATTTVTLWVTQKRPPASATNRPLALVDYKELTSDVTRDG
jgi:hypothetical protein